MLLFIKIIVGCLVAIGIVALLCAGAFAVFMRHLAKLCNTPDPDSIFAIHLHEDLASDWVDNKKTEPFISEFHSLGFTIGKAYTIEEMVQVKCLSLFHDQFVGVLYLVDKQGYFFDILHMSSENDAVTVSTMPHVGTIDSPPGKEKICLAGASITDAYNLLSSKTEGLPSFQVTSENFRETVETYYKEEQAYRNSNGGVSFEEFKAIADNGPKSYNDEQVRQGFIELKVNELNTWSHAGVEDYFEQNETSEEERYSGGCFFVVPNKTDAEAFIHYLSEYDLVHEDHIDKIGNGVRGEDNIVELFDRINSSRSSDLRAKERGAISFPIEGRVYQMAG